jgi:hypothetical protein
MLKRKSNTSTPKSKKPTLALVLKDFHKLVLDVINGVIFEFLDAFSILSFTSTCKYYKSLLNNNLWRRLFKRDMKWLANNEFAESDWLKLYKKYNVVFRHKNKGELEVICEFPNSIHHAIALDGERFLTTILDEGAYSLCYMKFDWEESKFDAFDINIFEDLYLIGEPVRLDNKFAVFIENHPDGACALFFSIEKKFRKAFSINLPVVVEFLHLTSLYAIKDRLIYAQNDIVNSAKLFTEVPYKNFTKLIFNFTKFDFSTIYMFENISFGECCYNEKSNVFVFTITFHDKGIFDVISCSAEDLFSGKTFNKRDEMNIKRVNAVDKSSTVEPHITSYDGGFVVAAKSTKTSYCTFPLLIYDSNLTLIRTVETHEGVVKVNGDEIGCGMQSLAPFKKFFQLRDGRLAFVQKNSIMVLPRNKSGVCEIITHVPTKFSEETEEEAELYGCLQDYVESDLLPSLLYTALELDSGLFITLGHFDGNFYK